MPKINEIRGTNILMGAGQPEYLVVPVRSAIEAAAAQDENGDIITKYLPTRTASFQFTDDEVKRIQEGAALHISIIGSSWPPIRIMVQEAVPAGEKPYDPPFIQEGDVDFDPMPSGFHVAETSIGLIVVQRGNQSTLRCGDVIIAVGSRLVGTPDAMYMALGETYLEGEGERWAPLKVERRGRLYEIPVALDMDHVEWALQREPRDLGPAVNLGEVETTPGDRPN